MRTSLMILWVGATLAALTWAAQAEAQGKPPKVLVIFDTSNSMLWDLEGNTTYGDGSVDYPGIDTNGDGRPNDSRIYQAKQALQSVLLDPQVNVEFGLMRFYQEEGQNILAAEPDWYQAPINYRGRDNCSNDGQVLVDIGPNSKNDILTWMDHEEDWPRNKELRGAGNTPLSQALNAAQTYFTTQVIPNDPDKDCRNYYVLLVADGEQHCPGIGGDPGGAAFALRELSFSNFQQYKIKTWVVGFGPEASGANQLNQIARAGGTAVNAQGQPDPLFGTALFASHPDQLAMVLRDFLRAITPDEICDEADNDCDGIIDEGFEMKGQSCGSGTGACSSSGQYACNDITGELECQSEQAPGTTEVCDGQDNDCDGEVDEGVRGACGLCEAPPVEICDNVDNDCNGVIDDVVCPEPNQECINGECADKCQAGECFNGTVCRDGFCVTPCNNADCAPWICIDGACADPCTQVNCPPGLACVQGECLVADCDVAGCPGGQVCRNGSCIEDPCNFAGCTSTQGCRDGICFDTCAGVTCPDGQACQYGICVASACADVTCLADQVCLDGLCVQDPCASVICDPGTACEEGRCVEDECGRTTCPSGTYCQAGECIVGTSPIPEGVRNPGGDAPLAPIGEEACGCALPAAPTSPWVPGALSLLGLGMVWFWRRK